MPGILYSPLDRRAFLRATTLGSCALLLRHSPAWTAGAGDAADLHLALLADTHVPGDRLNGHRGFNPWQNLNQVVPGLVEAAPEAVVIAGDAARLEGLRQDYEELKGLLTPVAERMPVIIGLGNHDDRSHFFDIFPNPPGIRPPVAGKHVTVLEHAAARLIVLDSLLYVNKVAGLLGRNQRQWLAEYLPGTADRPVVLVVHHTLEDGDGDLLDVDRLFDLIAPHRQVKAILYGHSHVWNIAERQQVKLINLPAVGYNFRDQDPVGWVDAWFRPQGVDLTLHAFAGHRADDGKTTFVPWA